MTNRQTFHLHLKIPEHTELSQLFEFKEHDSYYYHSSFLQRSCHA